MQTPDNPDAPALHNAKISNQGEGASQYQAAYPGNQIGMPEPVTHGHNTDISMKYLVNIMIMNGDGRRDVQLGEQPETEFITSEEKRYDGQRTRDHPGHNPPDWNVGSSPEAEQSDAE